MREIYGVKYRLDYYNVEISMLYKAMTHDIFN